MRALPLLLLFLVAVLVLPAPVLRAEPASEPEASPEASAEGGVTRETVGAWVDSLRAETARIRGLEWKRPVPAALLSREELRVRMEAMVEKEMNPEDLARDTRILRRLGLLGPDEDPLSLVLEAMENMVGGFYDPDEEKMYLVEGMTGDAQKPVILHELVHALEDQYLDLKKRMEAFEDDGDRFFAEKCLGEGSAEHARILYQEAHPELGELYLKAQGNPDQMRRQMEVLRKVPAYLFLPTMLHYDLGPRLVKQAVGDDFPAGIAALYENPPVSQEQYLHPKKWFGERQDFPQKVVWAGNFAELAGEGWKELHDMTSGELDFAMYLDYFLGYTKGKVNLLLLQQGKHVVPKAKQAAAGWDASRTVYIEKEGLPIVVIEAMIFDTVEDATEAADAIYLATKKRDGGTFTETAATETDAEGDAPATRNFDYTAQHGRGRLFQRGAEVLLLDGVTDEFFDTLWSALEKTTFEKEERDTWDPALVADPFEGCDFVNPDRTVGVRFPAEGWMAQPPSQPGAVVVAAKNGVDVVLIVAPAPLAAVAPMLEGQLARSVPGGKLPDPTDTDVAGNPGRVYVLEAASIPGPGGTPFQLPARRIYLGEVGGKTVLLRAEGPEAALTELAAEVDGLAKGVVLATD